MGANSVTLDLTALPAVELAKRLAAGALSARQVADGFLARIAERDDEVKAFAFVDPEHVRRQADALDALKRSGRPLGALHGVPVALKDIVDTADMPTENGTAADSGRRPSKDASLVLRLRRAGAVILGKTVTTELAYLSPAATRNPHDLGRTPGGSSSGSAAAVAAGMAPLAVGTQTGGSVIRPASFCGVVGFKPSHGVIARSGVLQQSRELDTVGVFARDVEGAALLADVIQGADGVDPDAPPIAPMRFLDHIRAGPPMPPLFAFVKTPMWDRAEAATREAFGELAAALGDSCDGVELPEVFAEGYAAQRAINLVGIARNYRHYAERHGDLLSELMHEAVAKGHEISATEFLAACDWPEVLRAGLDQIFERYDVLVTPAAPGEAPRGLESTGDPAFNALWTLLGVPAVTVPLMVGENGMPLGVQLVGRKGQDERLMRVAAWLANNLAAHTETETGSETGAAKEKRA